MRGRYQCAHEHAARACVCARAKAADVATLSHVASKPGLLPQFRTQLRAPTIKCVGGKTDSPSPSVFPPTHLIVGARNCVRN